MTRGTGPGGHRRRLLGVTAAVIALDQLTKALAVDFLAHHAPVSVAGLIHLQLYRNFAGSANHLRGHVVLVSALAVVAVIVLAVVAARVRTRSAAIGVGMMLGGGIGNLLDRLLRAPGPLRGGVVDWLRPWWSAGVMNLADISITVGVAVIVVSIAYGAWRSRAGDPASCDVPGTS